jgi:hypothetical protein
MIKTVHENESIYIPMGAVHRPENPGQDHAGADRGAEALQTVTEHLNRCWYENNTGQIVTQVQHHNMWVIAARTGVRSIITGGGKWVEMTIPADPLYQHLLWTAEKKFWRCIQSGEPPRLLGIEPPRPRLEAVRAVDMSSSNSWAEIAASGTDRCPALCAVHPGRNCRGRRSRCAGPCHSGPCRASQRSQWCEPLKGGVASTGT